MGQGRVDRGRVQVSNSSTLRSATARFSQACGVTWWLLCQEMWKVSRALPGSREGSWSFHPEHAGELGCQGVSCDSCSGWPRGDLLHVALTPEECVPLLGAPVGVSVRCMTWAAQGPAGK